MSLILDALKRSEEERHENSDEIVLAEYRVHEGKSYSLVPWMIGLILLLNVAALGFLFVLQPWKDTETEPLPRSIVKAPEIKQSALTPEAIDNSSQDEQTEAVIQAKPLLAESLEPPEPVNSEIPERPLSAEQLPRPVKKKPVSRPAEKTAKKSSEEKVPEIDKNKEEKPVTNTAASSDKYADLLRMEDVPDAVRAKLQGFDVNAHVYSEEASKRFVLLNLQKRREGDKINDYTLESILPNGLVINFGEGKTLLPLGQ